MKAKYLIQEHLIHHCGFDLKVLITWYDFNVELLEYDTEERSDTYKCRGTGNDGEEYEGIAEFSYGELVEISEIIKLK
jgi:hypothetical protein